MQEDTLYSIWSSPKISGGILCDTGHSLRMSGNRRRRGDETTPRMSFQSRFSCQHDWGKLVWWILWCSPDMSSKNGWCEFPLTIAFRSWLVIINCELLIINYSLLPSDYHFWANVVEATCLAVLWCSPNIFVKDGLNRHCSLNRDSHLNRHGCNRNGRLSHPGRLKQVSGTYMKI